MEVLLLWTEWPCNDIDLLSQCSNSHPAHVDSVSTYLPGHLFLLPPFYALFFNGFVVLLWGGWREVFVVWFLFPPRSCLFNLCRPSATFSSFLVLHDEPFLNLKVVMLGNQQALLAPSFLWALFQAVQVCSPAVKVCDLNMVGIRVLNHI